MPALNYKHLHYFWTVAREGSIARATRVLHVTQPGISTQLRALERALGERLFEKSGRTLALTDVGRVVYRYADEIFALGRELTDTVRGNLGGRPLRLTVGISNALPKLVAYRLLAPALAGEEPARLVVRDDRPERLLADLSIHELDLVLTDAPVPPHLSVRAFNHLLGESPIAVYGAPALAERYRAGFPESLEGAPFLLPTDNSALRRSVDQWMDAAGVRPATVAEIEDSAVLKVFGQAGAGLFAAPAVVEEEIRRQYGVEPLGRLPGVRERFYAVTVERRLKHPTAAAISEAARHVFLAAGEEE